MSQAQLENILRDLPDVGTLVKDRGYRQVWRFEFQGRPYYLKFYPRRGHGQWLKRLLRGSPAWREFRRLQALQKAGVPSPRAVAHLSGLRMDRQRGDAVILEGIEPSVTLDAYLNDWQLRGQDAPDHFEIARQLQALVQQLKRSGLGHADLHLGNILWHDRTLYLLDGYAVRLNGLQRRDILQLGHSVRDFATRGDLRRGWEVLGDDQAMPRTNPVSGKWWRQLLRRSTGGNRYFGRLRIGEWSGHYFKQYKYPRRWARASQLHVEEKDWQSAWPLLLGQIESEQLEVLKQSASGDVLAGQVILGGRPVPVVVKRPRRKLWRRQFTEMVRGTRALRAWRKSWSLIARNLPTAWPLIVMQRRAWGYAAEQIIVFERVDGPTLAQVDLDSLAAKDRDTLMRRSGRLLRLLERTGLFQYDAKASNWIVQSDDKRGPTPVMIDVDGIRPLNFFMMTWAIERLLRSLRDHRQYTPADSLAVCQGYAPFAPRPHVADEQGQEETRPDGGAN